ncbi:hypothetical protein AMATHDRAFT_4337 [Amanita thiersii Skay4041]|uniref:CCHC-type domain-containing protein n=1 Tax=Amanita thiersii Skay4041 TaxID=703135 RepID=A0A2A9NHD5_9AGAR|nr:hypothetical protein AMATHDRAFT_4337 [Amanita thiersii Skay4041]
MMVGGSGGGSEDPDWSIEQAMIQIQQLVNSVAALQNTIHQQNAVIQQLQAQQPVGNMGAPPRGPKMATPPIYDGVMATCEGFINITWVLGFMQLRMAQMFRDHFLTYMTTPDYQVQYEQSTEPDQIELLYRNIYKAFGDPNKQATTIQEVTTIKQGSKSAEEHIQLFKQSYMRSGYGETVGIHEFKRSLNSPLLDKCMAVPDLPTTLDKWYKLVIRLDCQWRQAVAEWKMFTTRGGSGTGTQTGTTQRTGQQGNTQRSNANQQTQQRWTPPVNRPQQQWRVPVTPAQCDPNAMQVDRNRGPIRCYNCGQTGHMARVCPNPRQQQTRLVNAWNSGTDANRDELWRMVTAAGSQAGGGGAHIEEVPVATPVASATVAQPPVIQAPYAPLGFQFNQ